MRSDNAQSHNEDNGKNPANDLPPWPVWQARLRAPDHSHPQAS
ncbi:hypothetical protein [Gluconobacter frateurii]|nr:hypothetical protein [Gluconobacter frateurii]